VIIDFRCRPPTPPFLSVFKGKVFVRITARIGPLGTGPSFQQESMELFLKEMDEAGITTAVITGRNVPLGAIPTDHIAELVAQHPGKLVGIGGIDPTNQVHQALPEVDKCIKELGLKGISMDPGIANPPMRYHDRRLYPVYARCAELNVPVFLLTGPYAGYDLIQTNPADIEQVASDFPRLPIVCSHGCWPYVMEIIGVAARRRNVFVSPDLYHYLPGSTPYVEAANTFLQDQILFATAYPLAPIVESVEAFSKLPFTDQAREKVLYKNGQRLLGLD